MSRARLMLSLLVPTLMAMLVAGMPSASAGLSIGCEQPDGLIRGGPADPVSIGDNIYNNDGTNQTKTRHVAPGHLDEFRIQIQNDGSDCSDEYFVQGDGDSSGFFVKYFYQGSDVTAGVKAGTFLTGNISTGNSDFLFLEIHAKSSANFGMVKKVLMTITAESDSSENDTVGAKAVVKRRAGDASGARPR